MTQRNVATGIEGSTVTASDMAMDLSYPYILFKALNL